MTNNTKMLTNELHLWVKIYVYALKADTEKREIRLCFFFYSTHHNTLVVAHIEEQLLHISMF